jgi:heptaprenylglyceryl phosphate synthase
VVSGSCRAELAEEAPEGPDVPLDESSVVVEPEDVQEVRRTSDLEIGGGVREKQARGSSEIVAGIEAMAIQS